MAANRRTISRAIVSSMKFLSLSKQAQALYMHIVINSDDDGICEAGVVLRATNTRKTALNELVENGYVAMLEPSLNIVWTVDWRSFVTVDTRYGQPSRYRETMLEHFPCYEFVEFKGNNGNSHASGTRTSEVKSSEDKRSQVKSSEVKTPAPVPVPSNDKHEQTELTTSFLKNTFDGTPDRTIPPVREKVFNWMRGHVFYDDTDNVDTDSYTDKFLNLCKRNDYKYIKQLGLEKALQGFIKQEEKYNKSVFDRYMAWTPETKVRKTKEELEEEKRKQDYAEAEKLMQRPDFNDLAERYYKANRLDYGMLADIDVAYNLITDYDILNSTEKLDEECEYSERKENALIRKMENHKTIDDYANIPGYDEFCKSIKEACEISGKDFNDQTVTAYCDKAYYEKGYTDFFGASESLNAHNIRKRYEMPEYTQYQTYSEYEPEGYENLPFE